MTSKIKKFNAAEIAEYERNTKPHPRLIAAWEQDEIETRKREARTLIRESQALRYRSIGQ